ncbi:Blue-light-activated protein [Roseimaritima multifibrata]|uniref:histidine kinase n=1 Tax=Roseimaritima multifibrata TaxID=1930274 RepID=A0A517ML59_9BACT|nr:DAHL domain-containing protein [Roseimaritima multifibrata]QDS95621.1 Blue-light-activated protein [Roseimaritima multifibrata]
MKRNALNALFLALLVIVSGWLLPRSTDTSSGRFGIVAETVRTLNQRNIDLDSAVLSVRLGLVSDYDELSALEHALQESVRGTEELQIVGADWGGPIDLAELGRLANQKVQLSGDFKANHAIVNNSLAGFMHNVREAMEQTPTYEAHAALARIEVAGARFCVAGLEADRIEFQDALQSLRAIQPDPLAEKSEAWELTIRHSQKLLELRTELDATIQALVRVPLSAFAADLMRLENHRNQQQLAVTNAYRGALSVLVLMLIGYCAYQFVCLVRHARKDRQANEDLEAKILERTRQLVRMNQELAKAICEAEKLALVAQYTDNGVMIRDPVGRIEWVNAGFTRITGYTLDEVIGKQPMQFLYGAETDLASIEKIDDAIRTQTGVDEELIYYSKSGQPFWLAVELRPIYDEYGTLVRFIAIESDITERKQAEVEKSILSSKLLKVSRQAGMAEVATGVLHNVGNVLNSVNVSANLLLDTLQRSRALTFRKAADLILDHEGDLARFFGEDPRGQAIPAFLKELAASLQKDRTLCQGELRSLMGNVEHIKEIVSMQQSLACTGGNLERLDLTAVVEDALKIDSVAMERHRMRVERQFDLVPYVCADRHKVVQVLVNLVSNARHAMEKVPEENRVVTVAITGDEKEVRVMVSDRGVGIPVEHLTKIFSHGFTTRKEGHGFGLHSSALACQEMGGALEAHSEGVGRGATFSLRIPVEAEAPAPSRLEAVVQ